MTMSSGVHLGLSRYGSLAAKTWSVLILGNTVQSRILQFRLVHRRRSSGPVLHDQ